MADKSELFSSLLEGGETHRLCVDFGNIDAMRHFMKQMRDEGLVPAVCEPVCVYAEGEHTVWLVSRREQKLIIEA